MKKLFTLTLLSLFTLGMYAQVTYTWRSEASNGNWNDANNWWRGHTELPGGGEILRFDNNNQLEMINNLPASNRFQIWFDNGSGSRIIHSDDNDTKNIFYDFNDVAPMIENQSGQTQTIAFPIEIGNKDMAINPVWGSIIIDNQVNTNNYYINIWGNNNYTLEFKKNIIGSGGVAIKQKSIVKYLTEMSYTGNTWIGKEYSDDSGRLELYATIQSQQVTVDNEAILYIKGNVELKNLNIASGAKVEVDAGKSLTISEDLENSGNIILHSDATNGTATLIVKGNMDGSGTATVEQYLGFRSWYMSSPVNGSLNSDNVDAYYSFTESSDSWGDPLSSLPDAGKGIMINPVAAGNISFTGTLLNDDVTLNLTSSDRHFHYLGNPYPSYLIWDDIQKSDLGAPIWFRTKNTNGDGYVFQTFNGKVGDLDETDGTIAPMQGFWVRTEGSTGQVKFLNEKRMHSNDIKVETKPLRSPKADFPLLRLQVTDGTFTDHAVIYFSEENSNSKDRYDAAKMMNGNNIPEIWTVVNNEATVINAMQSVPYNVEMPLGFNTKKADTFTIRANQFKGFAEGDRVLLIDKVSGNSTDITTADYSFSSDAIKTNNRFAIVFAPGATTGSNNTAADAVSVYTRNKDLVLSIANFNNSTATLYSISGQQIASHALTATTTTLASNLSKGVYLVVVENGNDKMTKRVVVK